MVNVKNEYDNNCFIYSVLAYLFPADRNPNRVTNYTPYINWLNLTGITSPTPLNQIPLFEKNNNLTINVFSIYGSGNLRKNYTTYSLHHSKHIININIDLLFISDKKETTNHYVLIKHFEAYMISELGYKLRPGEQLLFCGKCLSHFLSSSALSNHSRMCGTSIDKISKVVMPSKSFKTKEGKVINETKLKFSNYSKMLKVPFIISADIEAINIPINKIRGKSKDKFLQIPSCIYVRLTSQYPDLKSNEEQLFVGSNCENTFCQWIINKEIEF